MEDVPELLNERKLMTMARDASHGVMDNNVIQVRTACQHHLHRGHGHARDFLHSLTHFSARHANAAISNVVRQGVARPWHDAGCGAAVPERSG